ncbi:MAG: hypothetical protein M3165_02015, partial [Actinomycetota bacterium]|nr:hypothetical protein [Actinomycetota bacterium]
RALVDSHSTVLQFHGFAEDRFDRYGDVVVSDGEAPPSEQSVAVAAALRAAGLRTCLYDGTGCAELAATTNTQGRWARTVNADFLHLEVVRHVRDDRRRRDALAGAVVDAATGTRMPKQVFG